MSDLELIKQLKINIEQDIDKVIKKIDINYLLKYILITLEDIFNPLNILNLPSGFAKEAYIEELSYVLYKKLEKNLKKLSLYKIISSDFALFVHEKHDVLQELSNLLIARHEARDMEVYIDKQDYKLINEDNILSIEHPIQKFQHYYKLGYLRNVIESHYIALHSLTENKISTSDILDAATKYDFMQIMKYEIRDENTYKEMIIFGLSPDHITNLTRFLTNEHDAKFNHIMNKYLSNSQINIMDKCTKKGALRWIDLLHISIILHYISLYISNTIKDKSTSERMANNSKLLLMTNDEVNKFFFEIFITLNEEIEMKEVKNFLSRFTTKLIENTKRIDLQFYPIVNIENRNFVLFNTFSLTDIVRAYINNNNLALDGQGSRFEKEVYEKLTIAFPSNKIFHSTKYKNNDDEKGEIDICLIGDKNIYFIECKNSLHSISASSATNNYAYVLKAKSQLEQAEKYFNNDRNLFLSKHFKIDIDDISRYDLHKIIILSNRNISGLNFENIAVRDIYSLDRLIMSGDINTMSINSNKEVEIVKKISLYENKKTFKEIDFIKYINDNFIYFDEINKLAEKSANRVQYKEFILESFNYYIDTRF